MQVHLRRRVVPLAMAAVARRQGSALPIEGQAWCELNGDRVQLIRESRARGDTTYDGIDPDGPPSRFTAEDAACHIAYLLREPAPSPPPH